MLAIGISISLPQAGVTMPLNSLPDGAVTLEKSPITLKGKVITLKPSTEENP